MDSYGPAIPPDYSKKESDEEDDGDDVIGPALPPHLIQRGKTERIWDDDDDDDDDGCDIGPALPPHLKARTSEKDVKRKVEKEEEEFGVKLPPDYSRWNAFEVNASDDDFDEDDDGKIPRVAASNPVHDKLKSEEDDDDDDSYGPALPPGYKKQSVDDGKTFEDSNLRNYGPSLPPPASHGTRIPTVLPDNDDEEEEDDMIGPMPLKPGSGFVSLTAAQEFERRSAAMKEKLASKDRPQEPKREVWMMELPGYSTNFGLGPRSFRKTPRPEETDRSDWTDTPADKARKEKERAEKRRMEERAGKSKKEETPTELSQRDKRLADMVAKHNETKRGSSLVDMHTKERKRKLEEEGDKPAERRPFDRELDLNVNQFDDAKRKLLIKKSAQLNDKFSHGKDKVFL